MLLSPVQPGLLLRRLSLLRAVNALSLHTQWTGTD